MNQATDCVGVVALALVLAPMSVVAEAHALTGNRANHRRRQHAVVISIIKTFFVRATGTNVVVTVRGASSFWLVKEFIMVWTQQSLP
jgi:hypothetical protein